MSSKIILRQSTFAFSIAALLLMSLVGCGGYPEVSAQALELAKAVDNLCNLQEASQIAHAREIIGNERSSGSITDSEQDYLLAILDTAEAGDWDAAQEESRRLLVDQQEW